MGCVLSVQKKDSNRKKAKYCTCGNFLGGSFVEKPAKDVKIPEPTCVIVYNSTEHGKLLSVKVNLKGDRQFVFFLRKNIIYVILQSACNSEQ